MAKADPMESRRDRIYSDLGDIPTISFCHVLSRPLNPDRGNQIFIQFTVDSEAYGLTVSVDDPNNQWISRIDLGRRDAWKLLKWLASYLWRTR